MPEVQSLEYLREDKEKGDYLVDKKAKKTKKRLQQNDKNAYYSNGNIAYDVEPAYYPQEQPAPVLHPRPRIKREIEKERQRITIHKIKIIMALAVVFICSIAVMGGNAILEKQRVVLSQMRSELSTIESENLTLQSEITEQLDLDYVSQEATTRLGMAEPKSYQIVYITVPKESYTLQYDVDEPKEEKGFHLSQIFDFLKKD